MKNNEIYIPMGDVIKIAAIYVWFMASIAVGSIAVNLYLVYSIAKGM